MSRACDLGPGDIWALPIESVRHCRTCGIDDETAELCQHGRCYNCDCCGTCSICGEVNEVADLCACKAPKCRDCGCSECRLTDEWPACCDKCGDLTDFDRLNEDGLCRSCDPLVCQSCGTRGRIVTWRGRTTRMCCECHGAGMEDAIGDERRERSSVRD